MKDRFAYLWLIALTVAFCCSLFVPRTVKAAGQHEYKVELTGSDDTLEKQLNKEAKDGWEYVGMTQPEGHQHYLILRRGN